MLRLTSHVVGLALLYLHHFATFIEAAFGANAVWHAGLTAIRAQCSLGDAQGIVRASFVATSFGVSSFRIWHNYSIKLRHKEAQKAQDLFSTFCAFCALWLGQILKSRPTRIDIVRNAIAVARVLVSAAFRANAFAVLAA